MENIFNKKIVNEKGIEEGLSYSTKIAIVAVAGGVKQLTSGSTYVLGLGAAALKGRKAGLKTVGTIVAAGSVYNTARFVMGDFDKE